MGSRSKLLPRWYSSLGDINLIRRALRDILPPIPPPNKRGQPPKRPPRDYLSLLVVKEFKRSSLRSAETDWTEAVCGERVDHSVIHYWEKNFPMEVIEQAIRDFGTRLEQLIGYKFSVIDATSFADWHQGKTGFHLLNRITEGTVYPVNIAPDTLNPVPNTRDTMVPGDGWFMADAWYDVNKVFKVIEEHGYVPLVNPNKDRNKGYWRRRARKVFALYWRTYRQRGRGESVFGSLTNAFGDRMHTRLHGTTYIRSCARVLAYQVKLYIRATHCGELVIWANS